MVVTKTYMEAEFFVGDIGAIMLFTIYDPTPDNPTKVLDVSGASTKEVRITKPDGSGMTITADFAQPAEGGTGDGTDGKIKATTTLASEFSVAGDYIAQPYVDVPGLFTGHCGKVVFPVEDVEAGT